MSLQSKNEYRPFVGSGAAPRISVVAPCYNEEGNIGELKRRVSKVCRTVAGDRQGCGLSDRK